MLKVLRVSQFVLIDELQMELGPGLNIVTGETGAGKSILVSALQLVLGARARNDLVRTGAEAATVEALFDVSDDPSVAARLEEFGLVPEEEVVLRRVVGASGRTYATINGKLATAAQLRKLAEGLVDISSQHEHHTLVDPSTHLLWLDAFGRLDEDCARMAELQADLVACEREIQEQDQRQKFRSEREDLLRYQLGEIQAASLRPNEDAEIEEEASRLRHAERLVAATSGAENVLLTRDGALCTQLFRIAGPLREMARIDACLVELADRVENARIELEEAGRDLGRYARDVRDDPGRLAELEERLHLLGRLTRKYGGSLAAVLEHGERARRELHEMDMGDRLDELQARRNESFSKAASMACRLSEQRRAQAARLASAVSAELESLAMGGARVLVDVAPLQGRDGEIQVDGARLSPSGIDRVEFLIAPNRGEEPRPLRKVASGGELSRSLLALKRVLAGLGPVGLYVFDEVDAGVGGGVAEVIGRKLCEVAAHHQVLCITHLPQIASFAQTHFLVRKDVAGERTQSSIRRLDQGQRLDEIARMLGGLSVSVATRRAASDMIQNSASPRARSPLG
jgi:DNA repair protein RecN (Recombination protein N)